MDAIGPRWRVAGAAATTPGGSAPGNSKPGPGNGRAYAWLMTVTDKHGLAVTARCTAGGSGTRTIPAQQEISNEGT